MSGGSGGQAFIEPDFQWDEVIERIMNDDRPDEGEWEEWNRSDVAVWLIAKHEITPKSAKALWENGACGASLSTISTMSDAKMTGFGVLRMEAPAIVRRVAALVSRYPLAN